MGEPLFPDAVDIAVSIVENAVDTTVVPAVPAVRPDQFIRIRRVGGIRLNRVTDGPHLTIEASAPTWREAHDLAQLARQALFNARGTVVDGTTVGPVSELAGLADFPDPDSDQPRVTQTLVVGMRGT